MERSKEGDRVCEKNKEGTGRSWNSIKKSTRGDEVTSR